MGRLTARVVEHFRTWEQSTQLALVLALAFLFFSLFFVAFGADNLRQPALIGAAGSVIMAQIIVMWGNRGMVKPYTRAQQLYLAGEFDAARDVLEALRDDDEADFDVLTLLGNVYRQLGVLDESEALLRAALGLHPGHHFPLYGLGRTLLAQGRYGEAAECLQQALDAGAPPVTCFDLGEAHYRGGRPGEARAALQAALPHLSAEPHRALMAAFLLSRLAGGEDVADTPLIAEGLPHWEAVAQRFQGTPYGKAVAADVAGLHGSADI